jgi:hypothetical protein
MRVPAWPGARQAAGRNRLESENLARDPANAYHLQTTYYIGLITITPMRRAADLVSIVTRMSSMVVRRMELAEATPRGKNLMSATDRGWIEFG